jgi:APA family basic amino acid/polyamine antiporter
MNWFNWTLMGAWTVIGFTIYFGYGYRHSHLRRSAGGPAAATPRPAVPERE